MNIDLIVLLVTLLVSLITTFLLIKYSSIIKLQAVPNHRSMHKVNTPNSGGVAVFVAFVIGTLLFDLRLEYVTYFALLLTFFLGFYDDLIGANAKVKFIWLSIVASILFFNGSELNYLGNFFGIEVFINGILAYLFFLIAFVGFVNAMNLLDGLDGLASIVGIIILFAFIYLGVKFNDDFLVKITLVYVAAQIGFLAFNWNPAKIFMGDSGSLILGFLVAYLSIYIIQKEYITPVSILFLAAIPILDTLIVMLRRLLHRKNPFHADRTHIHHLILRQQNLNVKRTVTILGFLQLLFTSLGLGFKTRDDIVIFGLFILMFIMFFLLFTPKAKK